MKDEKGMPITKQILNNMADLNFFIFTGKPYINHVSSGFRAYSKEAIKKILPKLESKGYGIELEILKIAKQERLKIGEVEADINWKHGRKANLWKLFKGYLEFDLQCLKELSKN